MKILVVEDDQTVAQALKILLSSYNYAVDFATDGEAGLQMAASFTYDLMVLDVVLPRLDGISLCQQLRSNGFQNPILLLTGQAGGRQKAIALNAGADDYVVKPFDLAELMARIQALLHGGSTPQAILSWGNLSLDPNSRKVTYGIHLLSVTPKGYAILELLLRHPQKILSASAILDHVWTSIEAPSEAAVRGHIKELRQKLKAVGAPKDLIKTVYKTGYRLNPLYSPVLAEPVEQQPTLPQVAELAAVNEELRITLEQLRSTQAALHQKNQELEIAYQTIEQERQQLQAAQNELAGRVAAAEHTAELSERARFDAERTQTEVALQKSEEQLRLALDLTHVGAWDWDMVTGAVTWSPNQYPLLGYSLGEIEVSYQLWRDRVHPDDITWVEQTVTEALAAQRDVSVEYRVVLPGNCIRWILTKGRGLYNELGQPVRMVGFNFDITDRKQLEAEQQQTEATLRLSEDQRRLALDLTDTATWDLDIATGTVVWSDHMFRLFGLPVGIAEPTYLLWRQCVHPDDIEHLETMVQTHLQNQTLYNEEYRVIHPDGSIHWALSKGHGIYDADGQAVRMVGITMDITDRKQAEAALRESEERFRQLAENVVETVFWMSDPRIGQLLYVSPAYEQIWGRSCASLYANFHEWIEAIHPLDQERIQTLFFEQGITDNYDAEYRIVRPDGSIRWIRDRGFPIQNITGEPCRMVGMAEDVTNRKQAETDLRQSEEKYRSLFNSIDEGYVLVEVIFDENDRPIDLLYVDANPAAVRMTGTELVGRRTRELDLNFEEQWFETCGRVWKTGIGERHEFYTAPLQAWYNFYAFKVGEPGSGQVALIYQDVTERNRREANSAFLAHIAEDFSRLSSADEIMQTVGAKIGAYLNVIACNFCKIDEVRDEVVYLGRWNKEDVPRLPDRICLSEQVSEEFCRRAQAGETIVSNNTQTDSITNAQANAAIQALSFITVPFHKNGEWKYLFSIHDDMPRNWREDEIELTRELANRLFPRLERARTEAALRENEHLLQLALAGAQAGSWDWEISTGQITWSPEMYRMYGLEPTDSPPLYEDWYNTILYVNDRPWLNDALMQMVERRQPNTQLEFRIVHPQKGIRWFLGLGHLTLNEQGEPMRLSGINLDITERKQAEEALRENEQLLRLTLAGAQAGSWDWEIATGKITWSPENYILYGIDPTHCPVQYEDWANALHPEDRERVNRQVLQLIENRIPEFRSEFRIIHPQWGVRWLLGLGRLTLNEQGEPIRVSGINLDMTDRKQAEIELLQREEFLNSIYTGVEQSVFVIDVVEGQDFRYLDFNPVAERYSTLTCQQVRGKTPEEAFGQVQGTTLRQNYERCLQAGQRITYEEEITFPGQTIWTLTTLFPFKNEQGETYRIVGTAINITDRKQLEFSLQASEAKLSQILDSAIAAISSFRVYANRDWEYEYWSAGCERLFGYPLEDYADKYFWLSQIFPDDREQILMPLFDTFFAEQDVTIEYRFRRKDGSMRWFSSSYTSRKIADDCWGVTAVNYDITDRKQAEFTLQQQLSREQLIADISQEIRQSLDLNAVLTRTVERVREVLNTDRVIVFRFRPNWHGDVIMESVGAEWIPILSTTIFDPCFRDRYVEPYRQGRGATISDINAEGLDPCHVELLQQFQVKANLVVPIFQAENLWGLLIAHQCSAPRQWQPSEIDLLRQLATQVSIAIQQSELYEQTRQELLGRERMQSILEESEERFRTLSTTAPIGICQTNADGICLYTNAYWQEMSGRSFEESLGNGWLQAVHPDDRQMLFRAWETYLHDEREHLLPEFRLLTSQGDIRWVAAKVATMRSTTGEIIGYVSLHEDITERKRAEDERKQAEIALRESEQRLQAILDHAPAAIYLLDSQHRFLLVNRICAELLSTTPENAVGRSMYEFWPIEIADAFAVNNKTVLETGQLVQTEEVAPLSTGLHTYITVKFSLRDAAGIPYAVCGISTDITEKKQLEAQFYRAQRLESIGTLASGIAHDLNNVFTPILAISQLLRLKPQNLDARSQEMLKLLSDSAERGVNLVKQILTFARGSEGKRIPLQLEPLLREIANVAQQTFPKSIAIRKTIPIQPLWLVSADSTHLHQVLMNLCINARDAMPDGGTLTLSAQNQCIDATTARMHPDANEGNYVTITVSDTGSGISPELLDRIFDPFFTTKGPGEGTGLGLSTVLGIVKNHGGFLQVSSRVGKGTQFQVYLPAIAKAIPETAKDEIVLQGNGQVILIVDDEMVVQRTNQALLESYNFATLVARDGLEAIDLYREHQQEIYAVLLDTMMPNMDGITTLRQLRRINSQVKIIAISGISSNRQPMLRAGANVFLSKPYTMQELLMAIHEL